MLTRFFSASRSVPTLAAAHAKSGGKNIAFFGPNVSPHYTPRFTFKFHIPLSSVLALSAPPSPSLPNTFPCLSPHTQVRTWHNNERAVQIRLLKQLFFSPTGFPNWCLATNVIAPDKEHGAAAAAKKLSSTKAPNTSPNRTVRLSGIWTTIHTVAELQLLLTSSALYQNHEAYKALSEGFEHGHLRQQYQTEPQPLSRTLTTAAEAHFRMELYYALETSGFHHGLSKASYDERVNQWQQMIPKVFEDREANETAAWAHRQDKMNEDPDGPSEEDNDDAGEEEADGASEAYAVDPKYL
jgi:hypothetical protein